MAEELGDGSVIAHARRRSPSRLWTWAACVVAGAVGFGLVYANTVLGQVAGEITTIDNKSLISEIPEPEPTVSPTGNDEIPDPAAGNAINILLMGSDQRDGENGKIGGKVAAGMRNDTTIIMHIAADRSRVDLVSIPRDAQVQIADCQLFDGTTVKGWKGDFNIAFSNGGKKGNPAEASACVINTIQKMSKLKIHHWVVVDFAGFQDMVDAIGGVPMCIPEKIVSKKARLNLKPGPQVLNGKQALGLARMRTAEVGDVSGSDLQRIARQQQLLRQVARVVLSKNILTDAGELTQFLKATAASLTMDPELADTRRMMGLGFSLRNLDPADVQFYTVPWKYTDDYMDVLLTKDAKTMWKQLRNDKPLTAFGDNSAGKTWDKVIDKSPKPVDPDKDPTKALLDECKV